MRWSKKGALELSINAIVVLILAITILGLGIAFIRGQFGALQEQFSSVSSEVKTELINKIKTSGDLLVFNRAEIDAQTGQTQTIYFGIKNNVQTKICSYTTVRCIKALHPPDTNPDDCVANQVKGGDIVGGAGCTGNCKKWFSVLTPIDIDKNEVGVYPMQIQISGAPPDTYLMEVRVLVPNNPQAGQGDCATLGAQDVTQFDQEGGQLVTLSAKQFTLNLA